MELKNCIIGAIIGAFFFYLIWFFLHENQVINIIGEKNIF